MELTQNPGWRGLQNVNMVEWGTSFLLVFMCLLGFAKMSMNIFVIIKKKTPIFIKF